MCKNIEQKTTQHLYDLKVYIQPASAQMQEEYTQAHSSENCLTFFWP